MAQQWLGCIVSIDCGEVLGAYQGFVSNVDDSHQTISLIKAYRNGIACKVPEITICAQDIRNLKILKTASEVKDNSSSQNAIINNTTTVDKSLPQVHNDANQQHTGKDERHRTQSVSEVRRKTTTPKKIENRKKWHDKDEACFSAPVNSYILENDFDFEKNLALFDKQAVFDEINATSKPDVVRLVDSNKRPQKYRCDENILENEPAVYRQISVPVADKKEYVTDTGLVVPSIPLKLRAKLFSMAEKHGLSIERQLEMIGRAASDMALQLLGGSYRLNPQNTHQRPVVVILCGPHFQGLQGIVCGRHLANHGANVVLYFSTNVQHSPLLRTELMLYLLTDGTHVTNVRDLPSGLVDLIIWAVDDHEYVTSSSEQSWHKTLVLWASNCRAPILALDPPAEGIAIEPRWSICPGLPSALTSAGSVYLCDVGIPKKVFSQIDIVYSSPFGPKSLIPLHNKNC